jgi:hypothetical protein
MNKRDRRSRIRAWLGRVVNRTHEELAELRKRQTLRRMAAVNPSTYTGQFFIGRNDSCYCGNTYAGTKLRDKGGNFVRDEEGDIKEVPVKLKHCCLSKHEGLEPGEITPEMAKVAKKQKTYFDKHRRLPE